MKKLVLFIVLLTGFCAYAQIDKAVPNPPSPPRLVNDLTGNFLTPEQVEALERKLVTYDDSTSNQIAVVILDDLKGYEASEFATALGQKWGVGGQQKFDNGVVILISTGGGEGNRDAYIAVGYGLEGAIPDITANNILNNHLIPAFQSGDYYRGLDETTSALMQAAAGEYAPPSGYRKQREKKGPGFGKILLGFIIIWSLLGFFGGRGGRGGGMMSRRGYRRFGGPPVIFPGGFGGGGFGSSGGGGFGGGGFGGFGGGGFGGGGAGGKW